MVKLSKEDKEFIYASLRETHSYERTHEQFATWKRISFWGTSDYTKYHKQVLLLAKKLLNAIEENDMAVKQIEALTPH